MRTAVITGANRGIGLELTRLLKASYRVYAVCRSSSTELESLGVEILKGIDVTSSEGIAALAASLSDQKIDLLINNAGLLRSSSLEHIETELDDWRAQYEINALAPLRVSAALASRLVAGSKLVIITSRMGSMADNSSGGAYAYRMSKAAVNSAGVSLAHALRPRGITVALLHPGYVRTDMTGGNGHIDPDQAAAQLLEQIEALEIEDSGCFRHANGEVLPW